MGNGRKGGGCRLAAMKVTVSPDGEFSLYPEGTREVQKFSNQEVILSELCLRTTAALGI